MVEVAEDTTKEIKAADVVPMVEVMAEAETSRMTEEAVVEIVDVKITETMTEIHAVEAVEIALRSLDS